nr:probable RNA-dependent RNA polymerase 1 [Ipomoea batatas]
MCLQLPSNSYLPNFNHSFTNYNETKSQFYLGDGSSYSSNSSLGPIVNLPSGLDLPFKVVFKICSLVQRGYSPRPVLDEKFFQSVHLKRSTIGLSSRGKAGEEHGQRDCFHDDIDCFFRVSFVDEDREKTHSIDLCSCPFSGGDISRMEIYNRILATLENGIVIENAGLR